MNLNALRLIRAILPNLLAGLSIGLAGLASHATDLSNIPLNTSTATAMRPNIMFVLDDSGSMSSRFMPDYVSASLCKKDTTATWDVACVPMDPPYYSAGFNSMYYNPAFIYSPPANADGTVKADQVRTVSGVQHWDQVQPSPFLSPVPHQITLKRSMETSFGAQATVPRPIKKRTRNTAASTALPTYRCRSPRVERLQL